MAEAITVNRAPVLTLWGVVVAERLGYEPETALTLGKCLAGLNAQRKGRMLGIYGPPKTGESAKGEKVGLGEDFWIELCGRGLPAKNTPDGIRAVVKEKPIDPASVRKYLDGKFGDDLEAAWQAMVELAGAFETERLGEVAYGLYEKFRPKIPPGRRGWGAKGLLDLNLIVSMAKKA